MKAKLLAVLCALAVYGCATVVPTMAPIVRGEVLEPGGGRKMLNDQQLAECRSWLKASQKDWGRVRSLPPDPVSTLSITHSDGARTYVQMYTGRPGWDDRLMIRSYDKNGTLQFSGTEGFSDTELAGLRACTG